MFKCVDNFILSLLTHEFIIIITKYCRIPCSLTFEKKTAVKMYLIVLADLSRLCQIEYKTQTII